MKGAIFEPFVYFGLGRMSAPHPAFIFYLLIGFAFFTGIAANMIWNSICRRCKRRRGSMIHFSGMFADKILLEDDAEPQMFQAPGSSVIHWSRECAAYKLIKHPSERSLCQMCGKKSKAALHARDEMIIDEISV